MTTNSKYQSDRIYLRPVRESDVDQKYLDWFQDETVVEYLEVKNLTKNEILEYVEFGLKTKSYFIYAICDKENDLHIGNIKVGNIVLKHKISDLVTVIGQRDYWGKGYASEAIRVGNSLAFEEYDIRKLTGGMYAVNVASIRCYTNADWIIEGILKGHYVRNGKPCDRVLVSCFNPKYFNLNEIVGIPIDTILDAKEN